MNKLMAKLRRARDRQRLKKSIRQLGMRVCAYHASTNSYTVKHERTGRIYHAYVNSVGEEIFEGLMYV